MRLVLLCLVAAFASGCDHPHTDKSARQKQPLGTLDAAASFPSIYPLADGCAYVQGVFDSAIWYVCEDKAMRVGGAQVSAGADIYPLADGGALTSDHERGKIVSLKGAVAVDVTPGTLERKQAHSPTNLAGFYLATATAAANRAAADKAADLAMQEHAARRDE
jgi:hypothetical protein